VRSVFSSLVTYGVLAALIGAIAAAFSCKVFDTPNETCDPSGLDAQRMHGEVDDGDCSRCLENNCCDVVGDCANVPGCSDIVKGVHECVLNAGIHAASAEQGCADAGDHSLNGTTDGHPQANSAYRCMREKCGIQCGLPVCRVDPAAVLLTNAKCDECYAGSCCAQINTCYGSRACKLMLECIAGCSDFPDAAPPPMPNIDVNTDRLCNTTTAPRPNDPPACVRTCICRFRNNDQGLPPIDGPNPASLAARVYECGNDAGCLPECAKGPDDAGTGR
jgi:hypothetical protein